MDIEKRALSLLCGECDLDEEDYCPGLPIDASEALRAVIAALTPPEGWVLVPVEPDCSELPNYAAGLWSRRNWDAALTDLLASRPEPTDDP